MNEVEAKTGTPLKTFCERVFGVPVDGVLHAIGDKYITIKLYFHGNEWTEKRSKETEFIFPYNHEKNGQTFRFKFPEKKK